MEHLKNRDFTVIIDRSGSMDSQVSSSDKRSRWKACQESTVQLARKLNEFDPDGITLYDFNDKFTRHDNTDEKEVERIFGSKGPGGSTDLTGVLEHAFANYISRKKAGKTQPNGELMVIVTDGAPNDEATVAKAIVRVTKQLDDSKELSLIFVQVGDDQHAAEFLNGLDDDLEKQGAKYDIVSCLAMDKIGNKPLEEVLLEAVTEAKIHAA